MRQWSILKTFQNTSLKFLKKSRNCNHLRFTVYCLNYLSFSDSKKNKISLVFVFKKTAMGSIGQATRLWSCKYIFNFLYKSVINVNFSCSTNFLSYHFRFSAEHSAQKIIIFRMSKVKMVRPLRRTFRRIFLPTAARCCVWLHGLYFLSPVFPLDILFSWLVWWTMCYTF